MKKSIIQISFIVCLIISSSFVTKYTQDTEDYYVYSDNWIHGIPTGFMGEQNGKSMKLNGEYTINPYKGDKCLQITTDNTEGWRGLHIQYTGAWNVALDKDTKLADVSTYEKFEFYARVDASDQPYILTEVGVGGGSTNEEGISDTYLEIGTEWKKYSINIKGNDLKRLNTMMYLSLPTGVLYLDEIKFIKKIKKS